MATLQLNTIDWFGGFFTRALHLRGRSSGILENDLGYSQGRLAQGWWLLFMLDMPGPDDFEFRGYTHMSGGVAQGHLPNPPDPRNAEQKLGDMGHTAVSLAGFKRRFITENFTLHGPERLAKVLPKTSGGAYPVGRGIPQWELRRPLRFRVAADVGPGGSYLGGYT